MPGWFPCGCCGVQCEVFSDNFDRANGPIGSDWTIVSGTGYINSNDAIVSGSPGIVILNETNTGSVAHMIVDYALNGSPPLGTTYRIGGVIAWQDEQNHLSGVFGKIHTSDRKFLSLYQVLSGVQTNLCEVIIGVGNTGTLHLCYDGTYFYGGVGNAPLNLSIKSVATGIGNKAGLVYHKLDSGLQGKFNDFSYNRTGYQITDCPTCASGHCRQCDDDICSIDVDFAGFSFNFCSRCTYIDTGAPERFIANEYNLFGLYIGGECVYAAPHIPSTISPQCYVGNYIILSQPISGTLVVDIYLDFHQQFGARVTGQRTVSVGPGTGCADAIDGLVINLANSGVTTPNCTLTNATATLAVNRTWVP